MEQASKKNRIWIVFVIIFVVALGVLGWLLWKNQSKEEEPSSNSNEKDNQQSVDVALYQACDDDSCIYLLGAIHLGDERILNLPAKVWDAYNESDALAVEVDVTDISSETQENLLSLLMLPEEDELSNHLTPDQFETLKEFLSKNGVDIDIYKSFTLAGIYSIMSELLYKDYPIPGTDSQLLMKAKIEQKEVIELETYEFQMNLLYGKSEEDYVEAIMQIIDSFEEERKGVSKLYEAYLSADIPELEKFLFENAEENEAEYKELFYDRNIPMTDKAESFLKENKEVMITVGAGHIIGDKGIAKLLQDRGYKVSLVK